MWTVLSATNTDELAAVGTGTRYRMKSTRPANNNGSLISGKYVVTSITLSLLAMAIVFYLTYSPGLLSYLSWGILPGLMIAVAVTMLRVWFISTKIKLLAEGELSWNACLRVTLTWDFASALTPSTIGGAPVATFAMTREGMQLGKSTAMILYGVLLDQIWYAMAVPILFIAGVWFEVIPPEIGFVGAATMVLIYIGLVVHGAVLGYGLLVRPSAVGKLAGTIFSIPFLRRYRKKVMAEASNLEEYSAVLKQKSFAFNMKAFYLSVMAWLCRIAVPVIVILSLIPADVVMLLLRSLAMNLGSLAIPTPGGSGGIEALFALFMGPLIERESFIGLSLFLWRFITYYIGIGVGVFATTWYVNNKIEEVMKENEEERETVVEE